MHALPTGTVTFLFTDIEGSTTLIQDLGDAGYARVQEDYRRLLRARFQAHGGYELETQGDGFLAAFQSARAAVLTSAEAQRAIAAHPWPDGVALRVRMGLHTGEPLATTGGYVGLGLHRAARICQVAWGGQVLLSGTTAEVLVDEVPDSLSLRDLGEHRLKDLQRPERIYQLVVSGLEADFQPLRSLSRLPNNLPRQPTSFIGREREMAELRRVLATTYLLTLTGAGGCGKTRLALQVAAEMADAYRDGVWLVELAPLSDPGLVPQRVAEALGVREQPGRPLITTLIEYLQPRHLLLLLDNCEHLIDACASLTDRLLRLSRDLRVLATSREPLRIPGEIAWRVPSLPLPDPARLPPLDQLTQDEAIRLFIERATAALPTFAVTNRNAPAVAQICHRLDGIPLAIELAAARVKVMSAEQIASRLDDLFRLLTGGGRTTLPRHQTLRAAIDWSHDPLSEVERITFRRLSVFAGGWSLKAAEEVCSGDEVASADVLDLVTRLVDKSLVMVSTQGDEGEEARYWMLETIRRYAAEKLQVSGEEPAVRRRHRDHFLGMALRAEPELRGPHQPAWVARPRADLDNFRGALEWSRRDEDDPDALLRLAQSLWWFWFTQGTLNEARAWLEDALTRRPAAPAAARAGLLYGAAAIDWNQGDLPRAAELAAEALTLCRTLNDRLGIVYSLAILGAVSMFKGHLDEATAMIEEALALCRELGHPWETATVVGLLGWAAYYRGDFQRAAALCQESLALFRRVGDRWGAGSVLGHLGRAIARLGDSIQASALLEESIDAARALGNRLQLAMSLHELARVVLAMDDVDRAASFEREALMLRREQGEQWGIAECLEGFAAIAMSRKEPARAARLFGAASALRETIGMPLPPSDHAGTLRARESLRVVLGRGRFDQEWAAGHALSAEQAVEDALRGDL